MAEAQFNIKRVFLNDVSFELPMGAQAFTQQNKADVNVELSSRNHRLDDQHYQVDLRVTVTAKHDDATAYIAEVEQSGIFECLNLEGDALKQVLSILCLNILFPYVREALDNLITKASFPPVNLQPINFEALYRDAQQAEQQKDAPQH